MALFRVDFCGRGELADRQQKLAQMLSRLQKLSEGEIVEKPCFCSFCIISSYPHRKLLFNAVQPYVTIIKELLSWDKVAVEASYTVKFISWIQFSCPEWLLKFLFVFFFMYTEFNVAVFITNQVCSHELTHSLFKNTLNCLLLRKADDFYGRDVRHL